MQQHLALVILFISSLHHSFQVFSKIGKNLMKTGFTQVHKCSNILHWLFSSFLVSPFLLSFFFSWSRWWVSKGLPSLSAAPKEILDSCQKLRQYCRQLQYAKLGSSWPWAATDWLLRLNATAEISNYLAPYITYAYIEGFFSNPNSIKSS